MKKYLVAALVGLATALTIPAYGTVSFTIEAGNLKANSSGSAALPVGSLLMLIAAGADGVFDNNLTAGQYYGGDDVLIAAFGSNNSLDSSGSNADFSSLSSTVTTAQGEALELRWFPNITFANYQANASANAPTQGQPFGQFAGSTTGTPNNGNPWLMPSNGTSAYKLFFITSTLNATANSGAGYGLSDAQPDSAGYASSTITTAAIPEPSTLWSVGSGIAIGAVFLRRRFAK